MLRNAPAKYGITLPDRQLVCAPVDSPEGRQYLGAMRAAANFAWANRQLLATQVAAGARAVLRASAARRWACGQVYDVAHNIAKIETHNVDGRPRRLCVHRKGATRAFPPGHPELPERYRDLGQPVLIPGDMGRASYRAAGHADMRWRRRFGSTCHGAGRVLSRTAAIQAARGRRIDKELLEARASSPAPAAGPAWPRSSRRRTRTSTPSSASSTPRGSAGEWCG